MRSSQSRITIKTPLARKKTGNVLIKSTSLEKTQEPYLWFNVTQYYKSNELQLALQHEKAYEGSRVLHREESKKLFDFKQCFLTEIKTIPRNLQYTRNDCFISII